LREQQQLARKKRKLDEEKDDNGHENNLMRGLGKPIGKLKLEPTQKENSGVQEPEKEDGSAHGMPSPPESF
jgi:transcriptional activator SPT7